MAINQYLEQILLARYGEEVRQSIHDAIEQTYNDVAVDNFATMGTLDSNTDLKTVTETGVWNLGMNQTYINSPFYTGVFLVFNISSVIYQVIISGESLTVGTIAYRRRTGYNSEESPYRWTPDAFIYPDTVEGKSRANQYDPKHEPGVRNGNRIILTEFEQGNYNNMDGVLVNSLTGTHAGVNAISGDFSLQAEGIKIENGKLSYTASPFIVSGNILDLLSNVEMLANDTDYHHSSIYAPSALIKELSFAS